MKHSRRRLDKLKIKQSPGQRKKGGMNRPRSENRLNGDAKEPSGNGERRERKPLRNSDPARSTGAQDAKNKGNRDTGKGLVRTNSQLERKGGKDKPSNPRGQEKRGEDKGTVAIAP